MIPQVSFGMSISVHAKEYCATEIQTDTKLKEKYMPRIKPVKPESTDASTQKTLASIEKKLGILPNIFTTFAQSPASLNGYLYLTEALTNGQLSSQQREMIAIAVAQENECEYCLSAHAAIGKGEGLNEHAINAAREGGAVQPADEAVVQFALKVVQLRGRVSDTDITKLRELFDNDGIIIEIVANVALNILTNYMNRLADTDIDFPVVNLASVA